MLGKVDIAAAILKLSSKGVSKQVLENRTNLSASLLQEYLDLLKSKQLISIQVEGKDRTAIVKTTKRGTRFLNLYDSINVKYLTVSVG